MKPPPRSFSIDVGSMHSELNHHHHSSSNYTSSLFFDDHDSNTGKKKKLCFSMGIYSFDFDQCKKK
jgi:hypothetical protein